MEPCTKLSQNSSDWQSWKTMGGRLKGGGGQVATRSSAFEGQGRQTERQTPGFRRSGTFRPYKQG